MPLDLRRVTVYEEQTDPRTGEKEMRLVEHHPAMRLRGEGADYPVFLQDGQLWGEGGERLLDPPPWVQEEMAKCSAAALRACGFGAPLAASGPTQAPAGVPPGYMQCNDCGDLVREGREARHEAICEGADGDEVALLEEPSLPAPRSNAYWVCPDCGEEMLKFHKNTHAEDCRHAPIHGGTAH